ncbi:SusC/RagA family TonB-linked outer membrane protein [Mariniflexile sp. AS56]|uniref:SusC/RagA family TonB-linked outer membrane protein n=1 Tax=Mariniflexile sp. AS56 TaxID=3063957 RepID=UPI0026EAC657|nr:TonB-dependent receptor [Mariniflexile sp. AS56]MDO7173691.1 TonB-dependent receptor [Mariniflexile sp. AS56]
MKKLLSAFMLFNSMLLLGQMQNVSGLVVDKNENPLPGATIIVKGSKVGGVTDFDGNFTIKVSEPVDDKLLIVSYIGYKEQLVSLLRNRNLKIIMLEDTEDLDEIVVIGYGTVKKSDLTGAVVSIKAKDITKVGAVSLDQALAGRAAGVLVTQTSGVPGAGASIRIRGITSTNGSEPLYVVDGIPFDNEQIEGLNDESQSASMSPLSTINPSDIESIEVLKDASSTAIYGSRGANGVILITTKTGKSGKGKVQISSDTGLAQIRKYYDVLDANEYTIVRNEAYTNDGDPNRVSQDDLESALAGELPTTNWQDEIFRTGQSTNFNVGISGGSEATTYNFSTNISNIDGILKGTDFNRIASRLNLDTKVNDKLSFGTRINYTNVTSNQKSTSTNTEGAYGTNSVISRALRTAPTVASDAVFEFDDVDGTNGDLTLYSPLEALEGNIYNNIVNEFRGSVFLKYELNKKMYFRSDVSYYTRYVGQTFYQLKSLSTRSGTQDGRSGWAKTQDSRSTGLVNQNTFNYNFDFGKKHKFTTMIGQSINTSQSFSVRTSNFGFANDILGIYDPGSATYQDDDVISAVDSNLLSFFGRLNYNYNSKLLFTFTARADASSRFAENNKWGFFPAAAAAYNLHKENFIKNTNVISNLKLRLSYGYSGNQSVAPYQSLSILGTDQHIFGDGSGGEAATAIVAPSQLPNADLKWEYTKQLDFGIDFGLYENKITGTVEYYNKSTEDLLFNGIAIPSHSGFTSYTKNYGSLETNGFEFSMNAHIISKPKFSWTLGGNVSFGKTIVKDLAEDYVQAGLQWGIVTDTQRLIIGEEFGAFYGYKTAGIAQFDDFQEFQGLSEQERIDTYNANPTANYTLAEEVAGKAPRSTTQLNPGAQLYEDIDGNGIINGEDQQVIGRAQPDVVFGINNSFSFGNIDLSFFIDGQVGNEIANMMSLQTLAFSGNQQSSIVKEAWTATDPSSVYPRLNSENNGQYVFSDRFIENGSFIRLQNITLGYNFPRKVTQSLGLNNLRLYTSASNLFVLTKYSGYNPDVSLSGTRVISLGHDNAAYPVPSLIRIGVNVQF